MPSGLSEGFLFVKFKPGSTVVAADLVGKCFTHHILMPSRTPFESQTRLKVVVKFRMEIESDGSNTFARNHI